MHTKPAVSPGVERKREGSFSLDSLAVVLNEPESLEVQRLTLTEPEPGDVVVEIDHSGISTGTERLLYSGRMPPFPGMGYPLVPGYESVGRVTHAGPASGRDIGERVFVPGARCFGPVRGLFGGAAARVVTPGARVVPLESGLGEVLGEQGVLLALAATAQHAVTMGSALPSLIVGHGVLGRLIARLVVAAGGVPVVWETQAARRAGALGYDVLDPQDDPRRDHRVACDASGDPTILDALVARLSFGGEVVLAGFYAAPLSFTFPPAFMREAVIRIAAQWNAADMDVVMAYLAAGRLRLDGLITHRRAAQHAPDAYRTAFGDPECLKMVLDWRVTA